MGKPLNVGIVGLGAISGQYLETFATLDTVRLVAVADMVESRAAEVAAEQGVRALTVDELVADPEVDLVLNLTIPAAHAEIALKAIAHGKATYGEKPLAATIDQAREVVDAARRAGVSLGCAPDTVLGTGVQTARKTIDDGAIGRPIAATATMVTPGHERWHPNPDFYYLPGGGPLLDMGPYYVSALVHVFGPVASVAALGLQGTPTRRVQVGELAGQEFPVEIPSTLSVLMDFEEGGQAQSLYSTDSPVIRQGIVEITGTEGTIVIPDPNTFGGAISITRPLTRLFIPPEPVQQEIVDVEQEGVLSGRGVGLLDMARAIAAGRPHVATGEFGYHVLDTLLSIEEAAESRDFVTVESSLDQVGSIAADFDPFASTL